MKPAASFDVIVIGGGIVGCACAYEAAKRGARVAVIERRNAGGAQSTRALGFISTIGRTREQLQFDRAAARHWAGLSSELEADLEWTGRGQLAIAATEREYDGLLVWSQMAQSVGMSAAVVTGSEIHRLIPGYRGVRIGAVFTDAGGHAEPLRATAAFVAAGQRLGVIMYEHTTASAITVERGRVTGVATTAGKLAAPIVLCAGGVANTRILRSVGAWLPSVVVRGMALETSVAAPLTDVAVTIGGLGFRQRPSGSLYVSYITRGTHDLTLDSFRFARIFLRSRHRRNLNRVRVNSALVYDISRAFRRESYATAIVPEAAQTMEPRATERVAAQSMQKLLEALPEMRTLEVTRHWAASIDVTPDDLPVVGYIGEPYGLGVASGFSGHGFALGPLVATYVGDLLVEGRTTADIQPLRLARFRDGDFRPTGVRP